MDGSRQPASELKDSPHSTEANGLPKLKQS